MPILYSVISRGTTVLTKYATYAGNFAEVSEQIIAKLPKHDDDKVTYSHGNYFFHYITEKQVIYMCVTENEFERPRAFLFLKAVKHKFQVASYTNMGAVVVQSMDSEFANVLANEMKHYSESQDLDTISKVQGELNDLKDVAVKNIDNLATKGEILELSVNKAEKISNNNVKETKFGVNSWKVYDLKQFQLENFRKRKYPRKNVFGNITAIFEDTNPDYKKTYQARLSIGTNKLSIQIIRGSKISILFDEIVAYSVVEKVVKIQLKPDYFFEKCSIELHSLREVEKMIRLLPTIEKRNNTDQEDDMSTDSTDVNVLGTDKTEDISDDTFDSENASEHNEEKKKETAMNS